MKKNEYEVIGIIKGTVKAESFFQAQKMSKNLGSFHEYEFMPISVHLTDPDYSADPKEEEE